MKMESISHSTLFSKGSQDIVEHKTADTNSNGYGEKNASNLGLWRPGEHRLECTWSLTMSKKPENPTNKDEFRSTLIPLAKFNSLEGYCRIFNLLGDPTTFPSLTNVQIFREGKDPLWESFPEGGCWTIRVRKANGILDRLWEELLFATIAGHFEDPDLVGVVLSCRQRFDMLSVWNRSPNNFSNGEKLKEVLNLSADVRVEYQSFVNAKMHQSTFRNAKPYRYAEAVESPPNEPIYGAPSPGPMQHNHPVHNHPMGGHNHPVAPYGYVMPGAMGPMQRQSDPYSHEQMNMRGQQRGRRSRKYKSAEVVYRNERLSDVEVKA